MKLQGMLMEREVPVSGFYRKAWRRRGERREREGFHDNLPDS